MEQAKFGELGAILKINEANKMELMGLLARTTFPELMVKSFWGLGSE